MVEKVELKKFEKQDAVFLQENFSYAFRDSSLENLEGIIDGWKDSLCFAIVYDKKKVGFISLGQKPEGKLGFGIAIKEEYRGLGIATKAFAIAKQEAKERGYKQIVSSCSADNTASKRLHEKCGFTLIKTESNQAGNVMHRWEMDV